MIDELLCFLNIQIRLLRIVQKEMKNIFQGEITFAGGRKMGNKKNFTSLTFAFFSCSDAAFTTGNTVHPKPGSFHDKVTNMEALIRSLKAYYEVRNKNIFLHTAAAIATTFYYALKGKNSLTSAARFYVCT